MYKFHILVDSILKIHFKKMKWNLTHINDYLCPKLSSKQNSFMQLWGNKNTQEEAGKSRK